MSVAGAGAPGATDAATTPPAAAVVAPMPSLDLPAPGLRPCVDLWVEVGTPVSLGPAAHGERRIVPIVGGRATGLVDGWQARVEAAGADFQMLRADGVSELQARYLLTLDDGGALYVDNTGIRTGSPETMERIRLGLPVDPAAVYFRCTPRFETASARLAWMTGRLFVGVGIRQPTRVAMRFFEVL